MAYPPTFVEKPPSQRRRFGIDRYNRVVKVCIGEGRAILEDQPGDLGVRQGRSVVEEGDGEVFDDERPVNGSDGSGGYKTRGGRR